MGLLHERIKKARTDLHLSQNYVAKCIGLNRTAIVEIESGKRKVSADELGKFSELFHISADELLKGRTVEISTYGFEYRLESLSENDRREVLNIIEFKRLRKKKNDIEANY